MFLLANGCRYNTARGSHHRILEDFRTGKTQLLVRTQLVAKGHDFPKVTVVAVIGVDHILNIDFRSAERTFALVTQVVGRVEGEHGTVLLQTRHQSVMFFDYSAIRTWKMHPLSINRASSTKNLRFPPSNRMFS